MNRSARRCLPLILTLCAIGAPLASAHPHMVAPPLSFDLQIRDDAVDAHITAEVPVLEMWQGGAHWKRPRDADQRQASLAAFVATLAEHVEVSIDGVPTPAEGLRLEFVEAVQIEGLPHLNDMVLISVRYKTATPPKSVRMVWIDFTGSLWENEVQVPSIIEGGNVSTALLTPEEPEHTWHRQPTRVDWSQPVAPVEVGLPPRRQVPALALGLGLAALVLLGALRRRRAPSALAFGLPALLLVGAFAVRGIGTVEIDDPLNNSVLPTEAQAERIFATLQANVYRAFDAEAEDEIYDLLAVSVGPHLLDGLYGDIYESLTLREQGGVVCRVEDIETVERTVVLPDEPWATYFTVDWHWRVHGAFHHLGHTHRRVNVYRARFTILHDGQAWRIHELQVTEYRPIDEDAEGNLPDLDSENGDAENGDAEDSIR